MRLITDIFEFCSKMFHYGIQFLSPVTTFVKLVQQQHKKLVSQSQMVFAYVEAAIKAGLDVDTFAPRLSFFL